MTDFWWVVPITMIVVFSLLSVRDRRRGKSWPEWEFIFRIFLPAVAAITVLVALARPAFELLKEVSSWLLRVTA